MSQLPDHGLESGFVPVGPVLRPRECRVDETRATPSWIFDWHEDLKEAVAGSDAWGLLGVRPDGDVMLFDATSAGVRRCAEWSVEVRVLMPVRAMPLRTMLAALAEWWDDDGDDGPGALSSAGQVFDQAVRDFYEAISATDRDLLGL